MRGYKIDVTDSLGNAFTSKELGVIFGMTHTHICKLIRNYEVRTLKSMTEIMKMPRKPYKPIVFIEGKYRLKAIAHMFNRSNSWATKAYNHHGCTTVADFAIRDKLANERPKEDTATTINIEDIPIGTWEKKNYKCPPANKESLQQVFKGISIEEKGCKIIW